jgi:hypothetical protein
MWLPWTARWLSLLAWAAWVGGFAFYGGVVVPVLHVHLGSLEAGSITREVTDWLNLLGAACLVVWAADLYLTDRTGPSKSTRLALGAWAVSAVSLAVLIGLHRVMDHRLDEGTMTDFYPLHRLYLRLSTVQWLANLVLSARWVAGWTHGPASRPPEHVECISETWDEAGQDLAGAGRDRPRGTI